MISESLILDLLHQWLDHTTHSVAQKLVCDGLVTGLELEKSREIDLFYEFYTYSKMTQVPISKVQKSERVKVFCEKIHSDIWRPAQSETKKRQCYYMTFINDYS